MSGADRNFAGRAEEAHEDQLQLLLLSSERSTSIKKTIGCLVFSAFNLPDKATRANIY